MGAITEHDLENLADIAAEGTLRTQAGYDYYSLKKLTGMGALHRVPDGRAFVYSVTTRGFEVMRIRARMPNGGPWKTRGLRTIVNLTH